MRKLMFGGLAAIVVLAGACSGSVSKTATKGDGNTSKVVSSDTNSSAVTGSTGTADTVSTAPPTTQSPPTTQAPPQVQLVSSGFTQTKDSIGNSYVSYAAVFANPSDQIADDVKVNLTFTDANGTVVKSASETIDALLPGSKAAVADQTDAAGAVKLSVQALVDRWEAPATALGTFSAAGINTVAGTYGDLKTTGTLQSTFAKDLKDVEVQAVYYDRSGKILGGASHFVDFVPAGGKVGIEIDSFHTVPNIARTDVFATMSSLTVLG